MKKLILSLSVATLSLAAFAQVTPVPAVDAAVPSSPIAKPQVSAENVVKFKQETINVGKVKQGVPVTVTFTFTNTSKQPIVVETAQTTCGCTVPNKPTKPIMPGKSDNITATYNAASMGSFTKDITITFAGIAGSKKVVITGEVVANENAQPKENGTIAAPHH
jgi:hypothetical protein